MKIFDRLESNIDKVILFLMKQDDGTTPKFQKKARELFDLKNEQDARNQTYKNIKP